MPQTPVSDRFHCGGRNPGWLNGHHPTTAGEKIEATVCFNMNNDICQKEKQIEIRHCNSYYLYYLFDLDIRSSRYCSTSITFIGKFNKTDKTVST